MRLLRLHFVFFSCLLFIVLCGVKNLSAQEFPTATKAIYEKFISNYGIYLIHSSTTPVDSTELDFYQIDPIDYPILSLFVEILDQEFAKYPPCFVRSTGLKIILITRELKLRRANVAGLSGAFVIRYNLSFVINRFDEERDNLDRNLHVKEYMREMIQHEFFHSIDQKFNPEKGGSEVTWKNLQGGDTRYGHGGIDAIKSQAGGESTLGMEHSEPGFVLSYGKSAPSEDRATIYEYLAIADLKAKLELWCEEDEILAKKVAFIKNFMKRLNPKFDDHFWNALSTNGWDNP
jgi:hypothetical protein